MVLSSRRTAITDRLAPVALNDPEGVLEAVRLGLGKSLLPTALIKGDKTLRRLKAGDWPAMPTREIWLLTHPEQRRLARIEAVIDWLDDTLRARGMAHHHAPDKEPARRLAMIADAGRLRIPFTTGILLGIGETLCVTLPRNWRDTVWVEASGRFRVTERMLVSATLGYQSPASPDKTIDTTSPDGQRIIGAIGGVIDVSERISLLADARFQGIAPRTVRDSDFDLGNGTYRLFIAALAGHLRARF